MADGVGRADKAVSDGIRKVFERADDETDVATGEPYETYSGEIHYGRSPLSEEVRQRLGFRFAWGHERSLTWR